MARIQQRKEEIQREYYDVIENIKASNILTKMEKDEKIKQAGEYYGHLNNQLVEKANAPDKYGDKEHDFLRSLLPYGANSWERHLQLKYLDNWLNENPRDPYQPKAPISSLRQETSNLVMQQRAMMPNFSPKRFSPLK